MFDLSKKREVWHKHFIPSFIAGLAVGIVSFLFDVTVSNIILFASVGASAAILTNSQSHHLTKLYTTLIAYIITIFISSAVYLFNIYLPLHISVNIFLLVFLVALALFLFNAFHPPAITASLSFILLERGLLDLILLFIAILILFVIIRLITYVFSQGLTLQQFFKEFSRKF